LGFSLEVCKSSDHRYQEIRNRHYVPNKGSHGQQLHFLIRLDGVVVGIISAGASVYAVKARDEFFGIDTANRTKRLPAIVNNTVFRLEAHQKNLATQVLAAYRRVVSKLWLELYGVPVVGFETFVVETDTRKGTLYKADNWTFVGETSGSTKSHKGLANKSTRKATEKKLIYCKWNGTKTFPEISYKSCWRNSTPEEKAASKLLAVKRKELIGKVFED
jgi:hypothetical protein